MSTIEKIEKITRPEPVDVDELLSSWHDSEDTVGFWHKLSGNKDRGFSIFIVRQTEDGSVELAEFDRDTKKMVSTMEGDIKYFRRSTSGGPHRVTKFISADSIFQLELGEKAI